MFCASLKMRRLLVTCCVAGLLAPDIARAAQSTLDAEKAELQTLTEQYERTLAEFKAKRDTLVAKITQEEKLQSDRSKSEKPDPHKFVSAAEAFLEGSKSRPDPLPTASAEVKRRASANVLQGHPVMPIAGSTDPHKFVSAAEAFLNATSTNTDPSSPTTSSTDDEFQRHKQWIAEQDRKEHERQAAAKVEQSQSLVNQTSPSTASQSKEAYKLSDSERKMREALSWSSSSVLPTPADPSTNKVLDPNAPSGKLASDGSGRILTNQEKFLEDQETEKAFYKRRDEVDARINARSQGKESGIDRMLRNQEAQKQEQSGSKNLDGNSVFLGAMVGLFALGLAAKAQEDREYKAMTPEQRAEFDRRQAGRQNSAPSYDDQKSKTYYEQQQDLKITQCAMTLSREFCD